MDNNFRFPSLTEEDLASIVDDKDSTRTKGVISYSLNIVRSYCRQKEVDFAVLTERCSAPELNDFLRSFYAELRQGNGESYAKRSMITLRYGLQRHFLKHRQFDICKDAAFDGCNEMFKAILHKLKAEGKGAIRHKDPVTPEDMNKIRESFDLTVPKDLQNKVFLDLMLHLCNRGRENLRQMKKYDFAVQTDSANQRYVHVVRDMITKNHRGELNHDEESQGGRMYATGKSDCPVNSFLEYLSHLNENCDALWQRPKARRPAQSASPWYDNVPVGLHTLGNKMSVISKQAQCSKVYTNHCLRATAINKLDNAGFEARHIMAISGHRSENSIKHYSRVGESQKRRMSLTIASNNEEIATCSSTSDSAREVLRSSKFVRFSSTATTSNVPRSPSPPQEHAQSSQLVVNSQPTSSPININSSVSSRMHLHFNNCLDDNPKLLPILITCSIITAVEVTLFFEAWIWVSRHIPFSDRRTCIVWLLGIYPVFCATSLLGLYIPRASGLCTLTSTAFFAVCLYEFIILIVDYFGGLDSMLLKMKGAKFSMARPPILCLFQCLPKFPMTRRNFRILETFVLQAAIIRTVILFITEVLNVDGSLAQDPQASQIITLTLNIITLVSAVFAVSALIIFFKASKPYLMEYNILIKFVCVQMALILSNVQSVLLSTLSKFDVIACNPPFATPSRGYQWHCFLLTVESALMFIPTLIFFRRTKGNLIRVNSRVRASTFAGMVTSDGRPAYTKATSLEKVPLLDGERRTHSFGAVKNL